MRPILNHLLRFAGRLRAHGIIETSIVLPLLPDITDTGTVVAVGKRVAFIDNDGECRPWLNDGERRPWLTSVAAIYDPKAMRAHRERIHAQWLEQAAYARSEGWARAGKVYVNAARYERLVMAEEARREINHGL